MSDDYLLVGKIYAPHGIKGYVKVFPLTDDPGRFNELKNVYLLNGSNKTVLTINDVIFNDKSILVKFSEADSRTEAELLNDSYIYVDRANAVKLDEDEYFISDLIGLSCYDMNNNPLGEVAEVIQTGAVDVLVIKGQDEYLIPALKKNVLLSLDKGIIKVDISSGVKSD